MQFFATPFVIVAAWVFLAIRPTPAYAEEAPSPRMARIPPANFRDADIVEEIGLWWGNEPVSGVVFLGSSSSSSGVSDPLISYKLVPGTSQALRILLVELGFDDEAAKIWSQQVDFKPNTRKCLALAAPRNGCTDIGLMVETHDDKTYLEIKTDENLASQYGRISGNTMIGSSQFSLGSNHSRNGDGRYGSATTRGILARGDITYEYDSSLSYSRINSDLATSTAMAGQAAQTIVRANYRILATGFGLDNGARLYAGVFPGAYGFSGDAASQFFTHPSLFGVAYKSAGSKLSAFGAAGQVRLLLPTQSFVRIVSGSVELFSGMVAPGDQNVSFRGYQEPFVDVSIRDATGLTRTQRVEVLRLGDAPPSQALTVTAANAGEWYMDAGRIIDSTATSGTRINMLDTYQFSMNYNEWRGDYLLGGGIQLIGDRQRISASVAPYSNAWRASVMAGTRGEKGAIAALPALIAGKYVSTLSGTVYQPPANAANTPFFVEPGILPNGPCVVFGNSICYQNTRYQSLNMNFGHQDVPVGLGYMTIRTPLYNYASVNLTGSHSFNLGGTPAIAVAYLSHDLNTGINSISVTLNIALEGRQTISTSASATHGAGRSMTSSYTRLADPLSGDHTRSVNIGAGTSLPSGGYTSSAYVLSQFGPVNTSVNLNATSDASYGIGVTAAIGYAANRIGMAFSETGYAATPSSLFNSQNAAAVALVNNSFDTQTFSIEKSSYALKPGGTLLVPRNPGSLGKWSVAPGPAEDVRQPTRQLGRGQVALYRVVEGVWIQAVFVDQALKKPITPRHTFKSVGSEPVRLYADARFRSLLYETIGHESMITRWVIDNAQAIWRCSAIPPALDAGIRFTYLDLDYQCVPDHEVTK